MKIHISFAVGNEDQAFDLSDLLNDNDEVRQHLSTTLAALAALNGVKAQVEMVPLSGGQYYSDDPTSDIPPLYASTRA